jgi:prefoldin subunit 5
MAHLNQVRAQRDKEEAIELLKARKDQLVRDNFNTAQEVLKERIHA